MQLISIFGHKLQGTSLSCLKLHDKSSFELRLLKRGHLVRVRLVPFYLSVFWVCAIFKFGSVRFEYIWIGFNLGLCYLFYFKYKHHLAKLMSVPFGSGIFMFRFDSGHFISSSVLLVLSGLPKSHSVEGLHQS